MRLSEVYPLKVFPSVFHFKYIKQAYLTYPYHCCAFKFPATHDPEEFSRHLAFKENMEKMYCKNNPSTTSATKSEELVNESVNEFIKHNRRDIRLVENFKKLYKKRSINRLKQYNYIKGTTDVFSKDRHTKSKINHEMITFQKATRSLKQQSYSTTEDSVYSINSQNAFLNFSFEREKRNSTKTEEWGDLPNIKKPYFYSEIWLTNNTSGSGEFFSNHLPTIRRNPKVQKTPSDNAFEGVFHGTTVEVISEVELEAFCGQLAKNYRDVECFPSPDAFNPCEDVMGNMLLRIVVWIVVITSVMGNVAVMVVLMSTGACNSVSKFLMCNLAFGDFCMGCYLLMIAAMDIHSMGTYFNYAIDWQHGK